MGQWATFSGRAEQPPGAGTIISAEWDFEGRGKWVSERNVDGSASAIDVTVSHRYTKPGTYFPSFRSGAHRDGAKGQGLAVQNMSRMRVVVS